MILSKCVDKIIKIDNVMNIYLNNGKRQLYLEYNNYNNNIKNNKLKFNMIMDMF